MPQYYSCNNPMEYDHLDHAEADRENRRNMRALMVDVPDVPVELELELAALYGEDAA